MLIELFLLHCWGLLSSAIIPSPKEKPDGPLILNRPHSVLFGLGLIADLSLGPVGIRLDLSPNEGNQQFWNKCLATQPINTYFN
jgi:hypothetical protein